MVDLLCLNPTRNSFPHGEQIDAPCHVKILVASVGTGKIETFTSSALVASGTYLNNDNNRWSLALKAEGDAAEVTLDMTGTLSGNSRSFTALATQDDHALTFSSTSSSETVTARQNNGGRLGGGGVDLSASWVPVSLFIKHAA